MAPKTASPFSSLFKPDEAGSDLFSHSLGPSQIAAKKPAITTLLDSEHVKKDVAGIVQEVKKIKNKQGKRGKRAEEEEDDSLERAYDKKRRTVAQDGEVEGDIKAVVTAKSEDAKDKKSKGHKDKGEKSKGHKDKGEKTKGEAKKGEKDVQTKTKATAAPPAPDSSAPGSAESSVSSLETPVPDINDFILGSLAEEPAVAKTPKQRKRNELDTAEKREQRTLFIGNVPVVCSTSHPKRKALVRHILQREALTASLPADFPALKCDSVRFRSIAFASTVFGRRDPAKLLTGSEDSTLTNRANRSKSWEQGDTNLSPALTEAQKRKIAFQSKEINEKKANCNAYLVLDYSQGEEDFLAPFGLSREALLQKIIDASHGSTFEGHVLSLDFSRQPSAFSKVERGDKGAATAAAPGTSSPAALIPSPHTVPLDQVKKTVFLGGLDFAETENNMRTTIEQVLSEAMGPDTKYVDNIRIIRDPSTGLGKGIAYVLLTNDQAVDELVTLEKPLKISKRKVRVERCKTAAAAARHKSRLELAEKKKADLEKRQKSATYVKGAAPKEPKLPSLEESERQKQLAASLKEMPKEERKKIKATDAERVKRRAEKKKSKVLARRFESKAQKAGDVLGKSSAMEKKERRIKKEKATKKKVAGSKK